MFSYLYRNRCKPPIASRAWSNCWLKRWYHSIGLIRAEIRQQRLSRSCGSFGKLNVVSPLSVSGKSIRLKIGNGCAIGRVQIQLHDEVVIGDQVVINDGCEILTGSHDVQNVDWPLITGAVHIEDYAWIATGAKILPGVKIGRGAVVGAFAVVSKSVSDHAIVVGNPARLVGRRRRTDYRYHPTRLSALVEAWLGS